MIENASTHVTLDTRMPASRKFAVKNHDAAQDSARRSKSTRNSLVSLTTLTVFIVAILMLASCGTLSEEQMYAREDKLMIALEEYQAKAAACKSAGATMMITSRATRIKSLKFSRRDYQNAKCVRF